MDKTKITNTSNETEIQKRHQEICDFIHYNLWIPKNQAYGNSFHELYKDLGIISAVTQITHKYNRLKNLAVQMSKGNLIDMEVLYKDGSIGYNTDSGYLDSNGNVVPIGVFYENE